MSRPRLIALLLALGTLLAYLPVTRDGFVNYDDQDYVTENSVVQKGLTWSGIKWAFTTGHASNWHPLTWLSHMTDCELFGLNPGAHHFVNALFHAANTALLFILLWRLTNALWPAAFIAALFAWHPLHVESVAWISERKDVLSTFFALLALLAYTHYVKENRRRSFWLALVWFAFGLMSKPMVVTLPCVMLLLDYWPLQRWPDFKFQTATVLRLVVEKWPFFLLAAVSCVITCLVQRAAVISLEKVSLAFRLENSLVAYARYVLKIFWPTNLAFFYPLVHPTFWKLAASAFFLAAILVFVWHTRRTYPYLLVGWLWFFGMLVPVIGLVQVGDQAMADRYSYLPSVGVFIMVAFGVRDLTKPFKLANAPLVFTAVLILAACLLLMEKQSRYWRTDESLFGHAVAVTKNNETAHLNFGVALEKEGHKAEAMTEYLKALKINPNRAKTYNNIANLLDESGHPQEALAEYQEALRLNPNQPKTHDGLGIVLVEMNRFNEAMSQFAEAARLDPAYPWPHFQMGKALLKQGRDIEAMDQFREALRLDPDNYQILAYTAQVLSADENPKVRDGQTALMYALRANVLADGTPQLFVLDALGMACAEVGDFTNALEITQKEIELATAAKIKNLKPLEQRLQLYKNHQPWRESFLTTNSPPKSLPQN